MRAPVKSAIGVRGVLRPIRSDAQGVALDFAELSRLIYAFDYNEDGFISRQAP
jgi:hypothetical protein